LTFVFPSSFKVRIGRESLEKGEEEEREGWDDEDIP
jgi:hypothetical protein